MLDGYPSFQKRVTASTRWELDQQDDINRSLVGCWPLNESGGSLVRDLTGFHANGTKTSAPTPTVAPFGRATTFSGSNYINLGTPQAFNTLQLPLTITAWVKPTSVAGTKTIFGQYQSTTGGQLVKLFRMDGAFPVYYTSNSTGGFQNTTTDGVITMTASVWQFVAVTMAPGSVATTQVNRAVWVTNLGAVYATPDGTVTSNIGSKSGGGEYFSGDIALVRLYSRALSIAERIRLFEVPLAGLIAPESRLFSFLKPNATADVTAALTGTSSTGSVGTVTAGASTATTGTSATGSVGTLTTGVASGVTGSSSAGTAGTVAAVASSALSGSAGTGTAGSIGDGVATPLTGLVSVGSVGNIGVSGDLTAALTGVQAVGSVGTITATVDYGGADTHDGWKKRSRQQKRIDAAARRAMDDRATEAAELRQQLEAALGVVAEELPDEVPAPVVRAVAAAPKPDQVDWAALAEKPQRFVQVQRQVNRLLTVMQAWDTARALAEDDEEVMMMLEALR